MARLLTLILCLLFICYLVHASTHNSKSNYASFKRISKLVSRDRRDTSNAVECGGNLTVDSTGGSLSSPGWPQPYPSDINCIWILRSSQPGNIILNITSLDIEHQEDCEYDYLDIYVDPDARLRHLCGEKENEIIIINETKMTVEFKSDHTFGGNGFHVDFHLEALDQGNCPREITKNQGTITSPGWPDEYPGNQDCWTIIRVESDKRIFLNFDEISFESSDDCDYDYVEVYDGPSEDFPKLGRFCQTSDSKPLMSTNNTLMVHFHSDNLISDKGFKANFSTSRAEKKRNIIGECNWEEGVSNGSISSPRYPDKYPSNAFCKIQVEAPEGNTITVSIDYLSIEEDDLCGYDWLEITENDQKNTPLAKLCGNLGPVSTYRPKSNKITVLFQSDGVVQREGFFITYTFNEIIKKVLKPTEQPTSSNANNLGVGFATYPSNTTVEEGNVHVLSCIPKNPQAAVKWFKDGELIDGKNNVKGLVLVTNNTLKIEAMSPAHVGIYKCVLAMSESMATITAWIGIQFKVTDCPLEFQSVPQDVTLANGEFKILDCISSTSSNSRIRLTWEKNGSPLMITRRIWRFSNGSIAIKRALPSDEGIYTCVASLPDIKCEKRVSAKVMIMQQQDMDEICGIPRVDIESDNKHLSVHGKIVGGTTAQRGRHPWQVMIWDSAIKAFCGGAILNERWILTAAHCFQASHIKWKQVQIRLGKIDQVESEPGEFITSAEDVVSHPNYDGRNGFDHDIALVRLRDQIKFSNYILPVCLGDRNFIEDHFFRGPRYGSVAGWGRLAEHGGTPRLLKEIKIPTVEWPVCKASSGNYNVTRNMFCAGYAQEIIADSCSGDSGGPFVVQENGRHYVIGVVSWGEGCARRGLYGFYTKVNNYHTWIKAIIQT